MIFTFSTEWPELVDALLFKMGIDIAVKYMHGGYQARFEDDTRMRELVQWSAAAFACGLIESPRIERM